MECNKEEAFRARKIAETKMQNKDFIGAQKIAQKAQRLFPELDNISQMLTVCEVHCSANIKVNGEMDWYGILRVGPTADDSSIKKQYRKLALLLHPDKNQLAGAEAAFKLIGEAHMILSDPAKRRLYDMKRNGTIRPAPSKQSAPQMRKSSYARSNFGAVSFNGINQQQQQPSHISSAQTFWTICTSCDIRYQYYRSILNKSILCQNCLKPFVAYDLNAKAVPSGANSVPCNTFINPQQQTPGQQPNNVSQQSQSGNVFSNMGLKGSVGGGSGIHSEHGGGPTKVATHDKMDDKSGASYDVKFEKMNHREMHRGEQASKPSTASSNQKDRKVAVESGNSDSTDIEDIAVEGDSPQAKHFSSSSAPRRSARLKQNINYNEVVSEDDVDNEDLVNPPHKKLRSESSGGVIEHKTGSHADADGITSGVKATDSADDKMDNNQKEGAPSKMKLSYGSKGVSIGSTGEGEQGSILEEKSGTGTKSNLDSSSNTSPAHGICTYPDPEFFDFEKLRHANEFAVDQIWAIYDNLDGMPRFYARIRHVYASHLKLRFTWLENNPLNEVETAWYDADLPFGCGNYIPGSSEYTEDRLMFSHVVAWEKGERKNSYNICPRKGEVWALFKDWHIGWSSDAENRLYEYEVVEVLSDFAAGTGITVIPLTKIEGFVCLFMQSKKEDMAPSVIPPTELLRFSHNIPYYRLTGNEKEGVPQGCLELDPASLPTNFTDSIPSINLASRFADLNEFNGSCSKSTIDEEPPTSRVHDMENQTSQNLSPDGMKGVGDAKQYEASENQHLDDERNGQNDTEQPGVEIGEKDSFDAVDINDSATENEKLSSMSSLTPATYECPEAEFHNFDEGNSIENIQRGQIWAVYSDVDQYPKYYAWVKKVDLKEHRLHMAWLEACPALEEEVRWIQEGMPIACGTFKVEHQSMIVENTDTLSHLVRAKPVARKNRYIILPNFGEIWAVYKNWRAGWSYSDWQKCEYDVVEICECTDSGMKVRLLTKVKGYRAVFKPEGGQAVTIEIPVGKYVSFSHKIPAFRLTNERGGKLRGCWELDTASVPDILLFSDTE